MSEDLGNYDEWKLQYPPWYDYEGYECKYCFDWVEGADVPENEVCDWCQHRIEDEESSH